MAKLDRDALIVQDLDLARKTLVDEGKKPDERRLANDIHEDWEILSKARQLPESEKTEINQAVYRIVKTHRGLAKKVLPQDILEQDLDFYRLMLVLDGILDSKVPLGKIDEDGLGIIARTKRTIARDIIQPKLVQHVDQQVNQIIDSNDDKPLEDVIERVIAYLKNECLGKDVEGIAFYLVNEENYQGQVEKLTKTTIGIPETKIEKSQFKKGKEELGLFETNGEKPQVIVDHQTNKLYFELKIKGQQLGVLEIDVKPSKQLTKIEMEYVRQAMSRLDSQIDEALHSKRLKLITQEAHRILDEYDAQENFKEGIAQFMELVCLYSTAYEAEVMVDIFGDGKDWFAKCFNDDRKVEQIEMSDIMKAEIKIPSASRRVDEKLALVLDIVDNTSKKTAEGDNNIIGKVIFRTKNDAGVLTNEDHTILTLCSEILSSHILSWRNNLKLRIEGVDPQIARTTMRAGMKKIVKETLTALYTDIAGYTYISEILEEAVGDEDDIQDIETLCAVLEKFLNLVQSAGQQYSGVWDKAVGDMGIVEFGAPIDKNDRDPFGNDKLTRRPEYFAMNGLKAAILIRKRLTEVSDVFREKLVEIAYGKYSNGIKSFEQLTQDDKTVLLQKLEDETGLTPNISTTTSVYTGVVGYVKLSLGAAHDYTAVGNTMNSAARVQGTSMKMEIRTPLLTRDLTEPLIMNDVKVPINGDGQEETWSDFVKNKLHMDPEKLKIEFAEYYEGYKNKTGSSAVFTVMMKENHPTDIEQKSTINLEQLLQYEGEEFGIVGKKPLGNNTFLLTLLTIPKNENEEPVKFRVTVPQAAIDETAERYTSPQVLDQRKKNGATKSILVQYGKLKELSWESIEKQLDEELIKLSEQRRKLGMTNTPIIFTKEVPTGCYVLMEQSEDSALSNDTILRIQKDDMIFPVRVSDKKIHMWPETRKKEKGPLGKGPEKRDKGLLGAGAIMKDTEILYDFQAYFEVIRQKLTPGKPVVFVRKRHFYIVDPKDAEMYLMPIRTRGELTNGENRISTKSTSNPPAAETSMVLDPVEKPQKPSKFWTTIADQAAAWEQGGNYFLRDNWNKRFKNDAPQS